MNITCARDLSLRESLEGLPSGCRLQTAKFRWEADKKNEDKKTHLRCNLGDGTVKIFVRVKASRWESETEV
jgi:hypothetical protein